jgi:hypothetical protein
LILKSLESRKIGITLSRRKRRFWHARTQWRPSCRRRRRLHNSFRLGWLRGSHSRWTPVAVSP